jgi:hypothetical protein
MSHIYIGLDVATVTGISIYQPVWGQAKVTQFRGEPLQLFGFIKEYVLDPYLYYTKVFVMELPNHFRNAATTRNLLERYGFIKYTLIDYGQNPVEVNLNSVRSYFRTKNKEEVKRYFKPHYKGKKAFTDNHSDALAVAIYQSVQDKYRYDPGTLKIEEMEIK